MANCSIFKNEIQNKNFLLIFYGNQQLFEVLVLDLRKI